MSISAASDPRGSPLQISPLVEFYRGEPAPAPTVFDKSGIDPLADGYAVAQFVLHLGNGDIGRAGRVSLAGFDSLDAQEIGIRPGVPTRMVWAAP